MLTVVVVEDEVPARELLVHAIREAQPDAEVTAELGSVSETVRWLDTHPPPSLLFLDIQLSDGRSFEIFGRTRVTSPVVFATAYDSFLLEAFHANGIDYLLKPIRSERVAAAMAKYRSLREHFSADYGALVQHLASGNTALRERFLVRKGTELRSISAGEIAYFFTSGGVHFLVTRKGVRYQIDHTLTELESEMTGRQFFRVNRAFLVRADAFGRIAAYGRGKLFCELQPPCEVECVVSQERAAEFRAWLDH